MRLPAQASSVPGSESPSRPAFNDPETVRSRWRALQARPHSRTLDTPPEPMLRCRATLVNRSFAPNLSRRGRANNMRGWQVVAKRTLWVGVGVTALLGAGCTRGGGTGSSALVGQQPSSGAQEVPPVTTNASGYTNIYVHQFKCPGTAEQQQLLQRRRRGVGRGPGAHRSPCSSGCCRPERSRDRAFGQNVRHRMGRAIGREHEPKTSTTPGGPGTPMSTCTPRPTLAGKFEAS